MPIHVVGTRDSLANFAKDSTIINTTSNSHDLGRIFSPFTLGPVLIPWLYETSYNVENAWQYSKVYAQHHDCATNVPNTGWLLWAANGWHNKRAVRYPMGKNAKPLYSYWNYEQLDYIAARKQIYIPLYKMAVMRNADAELDRVRTMSQREHVYLFDYDGYDYERLGMSLDDVVNCTTRKMGHAFVLAMILEQGEIHAANS